MKNMFFNIEYHNDDFLLCSKVLRKESLKIPVGAFMEGRDMTDRERKRSDQLMAWSDAVEHLRAFMQDHREGPLSLLPYEVGCRATEIARWAKEYRRIYG